MYELLVMSIRSAFDVLSVREPPPFDDQRPDGVADELWAEYTTAKQFRCQQISMV